MVSRSALPSLVDLLNFVAADCSSRFLVGISAAPLWTSLICLQPTEKSIHRSLGQGTNIDFCIRIPAIMFCPTSGKKRRPVHHNTYKIFSKLVWARQGHRNAAVDAHSHSGMVQDQQVNWATTKKEILPLCAAADGILLSGFPMQMVF